MPDEPGPPAPPVEPIRAVPSSWYSALLAVVLPTLAGLVVAWLVPAPIGFLVVLASIYVLIGAIGWAITGTVFGALVDECNLMSLSRFQTAVWTGVVLGGFVVLALTRVKALVSDPLDITVPAELWTVLGISTTSLVGTPLVRVSKRSREPDPRVVDQTAARLAQPPQEVHVYRQGTNYANPNLSNARFSDMFMGDEVGDTAHVDLAKVQMFYFTVLTAFAYGYAIWSSLAHRALASELPELSAGAVALLGVSHGGYLLTRTIDHSSSTAKPT